MSAGAFVHLTSSTPAREHVEALLETLGRKESVLELPDEMPNEGPLHDIDADGLSRAAWRKRILGAEAEALPLASSTMHRSGDPSWPTMRTWFSGTALIPPNVFFRSAGAGTSATKPTAFTR